MMLQHLPLLLRALSFYSKERLKVLGCQLYLKKYLLVQPFLLVQKALPHIQPQKVLTISTDPYFLLPKGDASLVFNPPTVSPIVQVILSRQIFYHTLIFI